MYLTASVFTFITAIWTVDEEVSIASDASLPPVRTTVIVTLTQVGQRQLYGTIITTSKVPRTSIIYKWKKNNYVLLASSDCVHKLRRMHVQVYVFALRHMCSK